MEIGITVIPYGPLGMEVNNFELLMQTVCHMNNIEESKYTIIINIHFFFSTTEFTLLFCAGSTLVHSFF